MKNTKKAYSNPATVNTAITRDKSTAYDAVISVEPFDYTPDIFTRTDVTRVYGVKVTPANIHSRIVRAFMTADVSRGGEMSRKFARTVDKENGAYIVTAYGYDVNRVKAILLSATDEKGNFLFRVKTPAVCSKARDRVNEILVSRFTPVMHSVDEARAKIDALSDEAIDALNKELSRGDDKLDIKE